ncbi:hypothetical protein B0T16DRAFT_1435 [Cercophora newfieldiana]|uniref:Uncharacterized protein n=1 Tax=Cercophora newfieldiana TaxID=92897 RepID=A0AA39YN33_9PEZI|nr:hypothetical protein B0T16DRAFT_1435 [Cercophora newfieldiana]
MCFYEKLVWDCGYGRWGFFRQQCNDETRPGKTCDGAKLVYDIYRQPGQCRLCDAAEKKERQFWILRDEIERLFDANPLLRKMREDDEIEVDDPAVRAIILLDKTAEDLFVQKMRFWERHQKGEHYVSSTPDPPPAETTVMKIAAEDMDPRPGHAQKTENRDFSIREENRPESSESPRKTGVPKPRVLEDIPFDASTVDITGCVRISIHIRNTGSHDTKIRVGLDSLLTKPTNHTPLPSQTESSDLRGRRIIQDLVPLRE